MIGSNSIQMLLMMTTATETHQSEVREENIMEKTRWQVYYCCVRIESCYYRVRANERWKDISIKSTFKFISHWSARFKIYSQVVRFFPGFYVKSFVWRASQFFWYVCVCIRRILWFVYSPIWSTNQRRITFQNHLFWLIHLNERVINAHTHTYIFFVNIK